MAGALTASDREKAALLTATEASLATKAAEDDRRQQEYDLANGSTNADSGSAAPHSAPLPEPNTPPSAFRNLATAHGSRNVETGRFGTSVAEMREIENDVLRDQMDEEEKNYEPEMARDDRDREEWAQVAEQDEILRQEELARRASEDTPPHELPEDIPAVDFPALTTGGEGKGAGWHRQHSRSSFRKGRARDHTSDEDEKSRRPCSVSRTPPDARGAWSKHTRAARDKQALARASSASRPLSAKELQFRNSQDKELRSQMQSVAAGSKGASKGEFDISTPEGHAHARMGADPWNSTDPWKTNNQDWDDEQQYSWTVKPDELPSTKFTPADDSDWSHWQPSQQKSMGKGWQGSYPEKEAWAASSSWDGQHEQQSDKDKWAANGWVEYESAKVSAPLTAVDPGQSSRGEDIRNGTTPMEEERAGFADDEEQGNKVPRKLLARSSHDAALTPQRSSQQRSSRSSPPERTRHADELMSQLIPAFTTIVENSATNLRGEVQQIAGSVKNVLGEVKHVAEEIAGVRKEIQQAQKDISAANSRIDDQDEKFEEVFKTVDTLTKEVAELRELLAADRRAVSDGNLSAEDAEYDRRPNPAKLQVNFAETCTSADVRSTLEYNWARLVDLSKLRWTFHGDKRCEILFTGESSLTGAEQADACRLHQRRSDGSWAKSFTWESSTELFISKDRSRKQQRTQWATKLAGRVLEEAGFKNDAIRAEGILEVQQAAVAMVSCDSPTSPPKLLWKRKLAAQLGINVATVELSFAAKTVRKTRRSEDPSDPWG